MGTQETGHNVQFVERITTATKCVKGHFLKARTDHELRDDPNALESGGTVSDPQPNVLTQYEPVSRWTNEVAQTQTMESLPQNEEMARAGTTNGQSRSLRFSALETVVLQFLSTSQQCDSVVKIQCGDEPARDNYFRADGQLAAFNQLSSERGCLPLVPISQSKQAAVESSEVNRPVTQEIMKSTDKLHIAPARSQSKKIDVAGVVQKTVEELLGTGVSVDAPLMGAGLDSIAAVDLVSTLSQRLGTELEPTTLFDHPTIGSLSNYLAAQMEPELEHEHQLSLAGASRSDSSSTSWILYSEIQVAKNVVLSPANKSPRQVVIVFAFPFSGLKKCLSYF